VKNNNEALNDENDKKNEFITSEFNLESDSNSSNQSIK